MNFSETERVIHWTKNKRGRLSRLASALGFDRRVFHDRLNGFKTVSLDYSTVSLNQRIIESKEDKAKQTLADLKLWIAKRDNRKKSLAMHLQISNAAVAKWLNADIEDTCLIGWINEIQVAIPLIENSELNNYLDNRRLADRLVKSYAKAKKYSTSELVELANELLNFSNAELKAATVFFQKGKIVAAGWAIDSLSKNSEAFFQNGNQDRKNIGSVEMCNYLIENKHKNIDTVVCVGDLSMADIDLLKKSNPRIIFHKMDDNVIGVLRSKNITVCKLP